MQSIVQLRCGIEPNYDAPKMSKGAITKISGLKLIEDLSCAEELYSQQLLNYSC